MTNVSDTPFTDGLRYIGSQIASAGTEITKAIDYLERKGWGIWASGWAHAPEPRVMGSEVAAADDGVVAAIAGESQDSRAKGGIHKLSLSSDGLRSSNALENSALRSCFTKCENIDEGVSALKVLIDKSESLDEKQIAVRSYLQHFYGSDDPNAECMTPDALLKILTISGCQQKKFVESLLFDRDHSINFMATSENIKPLLLSIGLKKKIEQSNCIASIINSELRQRKGSYFSFSSGDDFLEYLHSQSITYENTPGQKAYIYRPKIAQRLLNQYYVHADIDKEEMGFEEYKKMLDFYAADFKVKKVWLEDAATVRLHRKKDKSLKTMFELNVFRVDMYELKSGAWSDPGDFSIASIKTEYKRTHELTQARLTQGYFFGSGDLDPEALPRHRNKPGYDVFGISSEFTKSMTLALITKTLDRLKGKVGKEEELKYFIQKVTSMYATEVRGNNIRDEIFKIYGHNNLAVFLAHYIKPISVAEAVSIVS